jgi:hypothetical protein
MTDKTIIIPVELDLSKTNKQIQELEQRLKGLNVGVERSCVSCYLSKTRNSFNKNVFQCQYCNASLYANFNIENINKSESVKDITFKLKCNCGAEYDKSIII